MIGNCSAYEHKHEHGSHGLQSGNEDRAEEPERHGNAGRQIGHDAAQNKRNKDLLDE